MQQAPFNSYAYEFSQSGLQNGLMKPIGDEDEPDLSTVGGRLAYVRNLRGLTPTELARRADYSQPTVWALENNDTREPAARLIAALAEALNTTWEFLLRGPDLAFGIEGAASESELVAIYRALQPPARLSLLDYARHLSAKDAQRQALDDASIRKIAKKSAAKPKATKGRKTK